MNIFDKKAMVRTEKPKIDVATHPLGFLAKLAKKIPNITGFNLVSYDRLENNYNSTDIADRKLYHCPASNIVEAGTETINKAASEGLDTVLKSIVHTSGIELPQLPMIDFKIESNQYHIKALLDDDAFCYGFWKATGMVFEDEFTIFSSGRSYHGYGSRLLSNEEWRMFMYKLLTLPGTAHGLVDSVIDFKWIGHRLIAGHSALRLSAVDRHYLHEPILVHDPLHMDEILPF